MESTFIRGATNASQYPDTGVPEIAFFGKSNTGKSTLINSLANRKKLAKTGSTPGMTQMINFFMIDGSFVLADLPGYGYAKRSGTVRFAFMPMMDEYFTTRSCLRLVFLLLDIRRMPGREESEVIDYLAGKRIPTALILTKADKFSRTQADNQAKKIADSLMMGTDDFFVTSSHSGLGMKDLMLTIRDIVRNPVPGFRGGAPSDPQSVIPT